MLALEIVIVLVPVLILRIVVAAGIPGTAAEMTIPVERVLTLLAMTKEVDPMALMPDVVLLMHPLESVANVVTASAPAGVPVVASVAGNPVQLPDETD